MIEAGIFQNFPGGIRRKGTKFAKNNDSFTIMPGEFPEVECADGNINNAFASLPYNGPSPILMELSERLTAKTRELAGISEIEFINTNSNTPVGTTLAMLDVNNRSQTALMRTIHVSFNREIQALLSLWGFENLNIVLTSDVSLETSVQKMMKAKFLLENASMQPQLHNMYEIYKIIYESFGIDNINEILKSPNQLAEENQNVQQPIDPAQVEMADIQQRTMEVESRERIANLNIEADGYKAQKDIELKKEKLILDKYLTDIKYSYEEQEFRLKNEIDILKLEQTTRENELKDKLEMLKLKMQDEKNEMQNVMTYYELKMNQ